MDDGLFVNLHMLSAAPISVCRRLVLQQGLEALGISMYKTTTFNDERNKILGTIGLIGLIVPYNIHVPRLKTRVFHGDWSLTSDAAIQSACFNTLAYLQKVNMLIIDGIHSAELKRCQRELLQASSWAEAFEQHADKLQAKLSSMLKDKTPVLLVSPTPMKVDPIQESIDAKGAQRALGFLRTTSQ